MVETGWAVEHVTGIAAWEINDIMEALLGMATHSLPLLSFMRGYEKTPPAPVLHQRWDFLLQVIMQCLGAVPDLRRRLYPENARVVMDDSLCPTIAGASVCLPVSFPTGNRPICTSWLVIRRG